MRKNFHAPKKCNLLLLKLSIMMFILADGLVWVNIIRDLVEGVTLLEQMVFGHIWTHGTKLHGK